MHDGPVRMLAKGVLRGIVPWAGARAFFARRLRRRLAEEALLKHIAGGGCMGGERGRWGCWLPRNGQGAGASGGSCWVLLGLAPPAHHLLPPPAAPSPAPAADESVSRRQALGLLRSWYLSTRAGGAATGALDLAPAGPPGGATAPGDAEAAAWADDDAFMEWAEGGGGAARVALELRMLRTRAAGRLVAQLAGTAEGTEGLVAGLHEALTSNPSLLLQLRSLVAPKQ